MTSDDSAPPLLPWPETTVGRLELLSFLLRTRPHALTAGELAAQFTAADFYAVEDSLRLMVGLGLVLQVGEAYRWAVEPKG